MTIIDLLRQFPGLTVGQLAARMGVREKLATRAVSDLVLRGVVEERLGGKLYVVEDR